MKMEVRCCCQPQKLLGWIDAPELATEVRYALAQPLPPLDQLRVIPNPYTFAPTPTIRLPIDMIKMPGRRAYPAIKAEGVDIETLRKIPGFVERT